MLGSKQAHGRISVVNDWQWSLPRTTQYSLHIPFTCSTRSLVNASNQECDDCPQAWAMSTGFDFLPRRISKPAAKPRSSPRTTQVASTSKAAFTENWSTSEKGEIGNLEAQSTKLKEKKRDEDDFGDLISLSMSDYELWLNSELLELADHNDGCKHISLLLLSLPC